MTDTTIAKTIISQLGGNKFIAMTGAKKFSALGDGVMFHVSAKTARGTCNRCRIRLTASDDYTVEFVSARLKKVTSDAGFFYRVPDVKVLHTVAGVYCDRLQSVFTEVTGLKISLGF